ncbi:serine/threonine protein kinase [Seiridium cupressi]
MAQPLYSQSNLNINEDSENNHRIFSNDILLSPPANLPRIRHSGLPTRYNEFKSDELSNSRKKASGLGSIDPTRQGHPNDLSLKIQTPGGSTKSHRNLQPSPISTIISEDRSSEFSRIQKSNDLGLDSAWNHHARAQASVELYKDDETAHHVSAATAPQVTEATSHLDVIGVGSRFDLRSRDYGDLRNDSPVASGQGKGDNALVQRIDFLLRNSMLSSKLNNCRHTYFVPLDTLVPLFNNDRIQRKLMDLFQYQWGIDIELEAHVPGSRPRRKQWVIFATLILMNRFHLVKDFVDSEICDSDLPIRYLMSSETLVHRGMDGASTPLSLERMSHWHASDISSFCDTQYLVLGPFFDLCQDHIEFMRIEDSGVVLPFVEWAREGQGGSGTVWKAKIHPAHHNFESDDEDGPYFAVKELSADDWDMYRNEAETLERFSRPGCTHKHLIRLLMAFQHGEKYYLLFPWADHGNLLDLWQKKRMSPAKSGDTRWLVEQCLGLARGLSEIHDFNSDRANDTHQYSPAISPNERTKGRHGDIKPQNILCFREPTEGHVRLVITDFGLTRFHSDDTVSNTRNNEITRLSRTYRPPEIDVRRTRFITRFQQTHNKFTNARRNDDKGYVPNIIEDKFFNIGISGTAATKRSVRKWIKMLKAQRHCPVCVRDLLVVIDSRMLVPDQRRRSNAADVVNELSRIWGMCEEREEYCISRSPSFKTDMPWNKPINKIKRMLWPGRVISATEPIPSPMEQPELRRVMQKMQENKRVKDPEAELGRAKRDSNEGFQHLANTKSPTGVARSRWKHLISSCDNLYLFAAMEDYLSRASEIFSTSGIALTGDFFRATPDSVLVDTYALTGLAAGISSVFAFGDPLVAASRGLISGPIVELIVLIQNQPNVEFKDMGKMFEEQANTFISSSNRYSMNANLKLIQQTGEWDPSGGSHTDIVKWVEDGNWVNYDKTPMVKNTDDSTVFAGGN